MGLAQSMDKHQGQLLTLSLTLLVALRSQQPPRVPAPSSLPVQPVMAFPVDAGVAVTLVHFRQTLGVVEALGADAGEAIDAILAGAPVVAGVAGALVDVDVAHAPWEKRGDVRKCHPTGCTVGMCHLPRGTHQAGPCPATQ